MRAILLALFASGCQHCKTEVAVTYHNPEADVSVKITR